MDFINQPIDDAKIKEKILSAILKSESFQKFKKENEENELMIKEPTIVSCLYLTENISQNESVDLKIILAELDFQITKVKENYSFPSIGLALLSEFGGEDAPYVVISIGDFVVPVEDGYDVLEFAD